MLSNIKKGIFNCANPALFTYSCEYEDNYTEAVKQCPEIKDTDSLVAILSRKKEVYKILTDSKFQENIKGYSDARAIIVDAMLLQVKREIKNEKKKFYEKGVLTDCMNYAVEYIELCRFAVVASIFFLIVDNPSIQLKKEFLSCLLDALNNLSHDVDIQLEDKNIDIEYRKFKSEGIDNFDDTPTITRNFYNYMKLSSHFKWLNDVDNMLVEELGKKTYRPFDKSIIDDIRGILSSPDDIDNIIKQHAKMYNIDEKILNTKSLLFSCKKYENFYGNSSDLLQNVIAFQEIYLSKLQYRKQMAQTTVKQIFEKENDTYVLDRFFFLDRKFIRGFFTIQGMHDEYKTFIKIGQICRNIFLKPLKALYDIRQYELTWYITSRILEVLTCRDKLESYNVILKAIKDI